MKLDPSMDAEAVIAALELLPHPEGGHYRETHRDRPVGGGRGAATAIYYLLRAAEVSHWHRIDAVEIWHWYAGAPLALSISEDGLATTTHVLGPRLEETQRPQAVVPAGAWQAAISLGAWSLVGCTVSPAFEFAHFEMAPPGWAPGEDP